MSLENGPARGDARGSRKRAQGGGGLALQRRRRRSDRAGHAASQKPGALPRRSPASSTRTARTAPATAGPQSEARSDALGGCANEAAAAVCHRAVSPDKELAAGAGARLSIGSAGVQVPETPPRGRRPGARAGGARRGAGERVHPTWGGDPSSPAHNAATGSHRLVIAVINRNGGLLHLSATS